MQNEWLEEDDFEVEIKDECNHLGDDPVENLNETNSREFVRSCIDNFFVGKVMHCGGKIPKYILCSPKMIDMVVSTNLLDSLDIAYSCMKGMSAGDDDERFKFTGEVTDDVRLVNETLTLLSRSGIPQKYAGGLMLLYLRYVKGVKINV